MLQTVTQRSFSISSTMYITWGPWSGYWLLYRSGDVQEFSSAFKFIGHMLNQLPPDKETETQHRLSLYSLWTIILWLVLSHFYVGAMHYQFTTAIYIRKCICNYVWHEYTVHCKLQLPQQYKMPKAAHGAQSCAETWCSLTGASISYLEFETTILSTQNEQKVCSSCAVLKNSLQWCAGDTAGTVCIVPALSNLIGEYTHRNTAAVLPPSEKIKK